MHPGSALDLGNAPDPHQIRYLGREELVKKAESVQYSEADNNQQNG